MLEGSGAGSVPNPDPGNPKHTDRDPALDPLHWMKYPFNGRCDVTKRDELVALYEGAEKHFGSAVEVFCNNAGINHVPGWRKCMDIDIVSIHIIKLIIHC
jgi:NAD(P)-dependent dehydrogenase (short-subunit alcohol dehydrogenase family)